jgi:hypothetical protein
MGIDTSSSIVIHQRSLPRLDNEIFADTSFFTQNRGTLPLPADIRAQAKTYNPARPPPVIYSELGLLIKYGSEITIAEGQCLWAIRRLLGSSKIPVPEIYAWSSDGGQVFLYMELVKGLTLHQAWDSISKDGKDIVCDQLAKIVRALRLLKQEPSSEFVGEIYSFLLFH